MVAVAGAHGTVPGPIARPYLHNSTESFPLFLAQQAKEGSWQKEAFGRACWKQRHLRYPCICTRPIWFHFTIIWGFFPLAGIATFWGGGALL